MSYKFALADLPRGGAKAVIAAPGPMDGDARNALFRRYAELLLAIGGVTTATDLGTTAADMDVINDVAPGFAAADTHDDSASTFGTASGVFAAMRAGAAHVFGSQSLRGRQILVQGAGKVGGELLRLLEHDGASIAFNDRDAEAIRFWTARGMRFVADDAMVDEPCEIFAPCAVGGVLSGETIPRLRCRLVAGAANNQLRSEDDAEALRERKIAYVPDFVANAGGAIAIVGRRVLGWTPKQTDARIAAIGETVTRILATAASETATPYRVAIDMAKQRLRA